ncbi:MAG: hypothetical protein ACLT5X_13770 [Blautia producta]
MGNRNHGDSLHVEEIIFNLKSSGRIQGRSGFVQNQNRRFF